MKKLYNKYLEMLEPIPSFLEKYLNVPSLVRLKNIGYFCGMDYASKDIYDFKEDISRFVNIEITFVVSSKRQLTIKYSFSSFLT